IIFASTKLLPWVIENHSCQEQAEPQRMGRAHEYSLDHHHRICGGRDFEIPLSTEKKREKGVFFFKPSSGFLRVFYNISCASGGVVSSRRRRGFHRRNRWRDHSAGSVGINRASS